MTSIVEIVVDVVAEISKAVIENADSMMIVEGTEIVVQDGVTGLGVPAVSVSHLSFIFVCLLT